jgi:hypothetical protein
LAFGGLVSGSFVICGAAVAADNSWGEALSAGGGDDSEESEDETFMGRLLGGTEMRGIVEMTDSRIICYQTWAEKLSERFTITKGTPGSKLRLNVNFTDRSLWNVRNILIVANNTLSGVEGMDKETRETAIKDLKCKLLAS